MSWKLPLTLEIDRLLVQSNKANLKRLEGLGGHGPPPSSPCGGLGGPLGLAGGLWPPLPPLNSYSLNLSCLFLILGGLFYYYFFFTFENLKIVFIISISTFGGSIFYNFVI